MSESVRRTAEIRDAWPELHAVVTAMRADWGADDIRDAMLAARQAGMGFGEVAREAWRLAWDADGFPAELRGTARRYGSRQAAAARGDYGRGAELARRLLGERPGDDGGAAA